MEAKPEPNLDSTHPETSTANPDTLDEFEEEEEDDDDDDFEDDDGGDLDYMPSGVRLNMDRAKMESLVQRLSSDRIPVRVYDIIIKGNTKTDHSLIESEVETILRDATNFQQLLLASSVANARLQRLNVFDKINITLDAGPQEIPGTANVVIDVSEAKNRLIGDLGIYSKPEAKSWCLEGSLKLKNLFGYGDLWDGLVAYGWGQASEISTGVSLPKFKLLATPFSARMSLLSQDWLKFYSCKEQVLGLSLGLLSTGNHDISYNLSRRKLSDPSQNPSDTVRGQSSLFSALKYAFKIDYRDSPVRPTQGYAFVSTTQIGGIFPDMKSLRLIRQEFDLRYAIPLGFYQAALNFGISGGVVLPWGSGASNIPPYLRERFFMGGNSSPAFSLRGPTSVLGFNARGLGPAEPRKLDKDNSSDEKSVSSGMDHTSGDFAMTAFADFSFDLPVRMLREVGIHGHAFACTGSLSKLNENAYREFSFQKFLDSFQSSAGFGIIIPTRLFRMEVNYCSILKQHEHDGRKSGLQFRFSTPR